MLSGKDVKLVYDTLLSSPGMLDSIKISLQISRKNALLLSKVIEHGLSTTLEADSPSILQVLNEADKNELQVVAEELLQKGGLAAMNDKLNGLTVK